MEDSGPSEGDLMSHLGMIYSTSTKKNCSSLSCVLGEAEVEATCVAQGARAREQESVG